MPTYPLATLAPTIDASGIYAPPYEDIYQSLIASFRIIYGSDIVVTPDSQDGQLLAIFANAIHDSNQAAIYLFQSFSPSYAQGAELSSLVKINGLSRLVPTKSTAAGTVVGSVGAVITNGVVQDDSGNLWDLPASVLIPGAGTISVSVTAQEAGAISAGIGTINKIYNPQLGWQSFSNTSIASEGSPIESDATLRGRQRVSTALPALSILESLLAGVGNIVGVTRYKIYENDTGSTDANGVPAHSFSIVAKGGTVQDIVNEIGSRKPPGIQTFGATNGVYTDSLGLSSTINYDVLTEDPIYVSVSITALPGYVATTETAIITSVADFINALEIGEDVYYSQVYGASSLIAQQAGQTFYITGLTLGTAPAPVGTSNLTIAYNHAAVCVEANVIVTVTP